MRDIKFRVWDKKIKESHIEKLQDLCEDDYWYDGETEVWSVLYDCNNKQERFIAMQFTGLHDKNGKEIYEGDIVKINAHSYDFGFEKDRIGEIRFIEGCFGFYKQLSEKEYLFNELSTESGYGELDYYEIIGNIYENSDLLKGADNIE